MRPYRFLSSALENATLIGNFHTAKLRPSLTNKTKYTLNTNCEHF